MFFNKIAVLIIHGFGGGIWETEYLLNYLQFHGNYDVYSFTLPGHEKMFIKHVKYDEWINASVEKIEQLIKKYNKIYVVGQSMGGVIASYLASKYKKVKKLVLLAPAFIYGNLSQNKLDIKKRLFNKKNYVKEYGEELYKGLISKIFSISPLCYLEFTKLVKKHYNCPKDIKCPVLIINGTEDEIVPVTSAKYVYDTIKSKRKYLKLIKGVKHGILSGKKKEVIGKYINSFLKGGLKWIEMKKLEI